MKFEQLNIEVTTRPLSTKQSRLINAAVQKFSEKFGNDEKITVREWEAGQFFAQQTYDLLSGFYGFKEILPDFDTFEDKVTLDEVCNFLSDQIAKNGKNDFLIQPLSAILQGMQQVSEFVEGIVDSAVEKSRKSLTE